MASNSPPTASSIARSKLWFRTISLTAAMYLSLAETCARVPVSRRFRRRKIFIGFGFTSVAYSEQNRLAWQRDKPGEIYASRAGLFKARQQFGGQSLYCTFKSNNFANGSMPRAGCNGRRTKTSRPRWKAENGQARSKARSDLYPRLDLPRDRLVLLTVFSCRLRHCVSFWNGCYESPDNMTSGSFF